MVNWETQVNSTQDARLVRWRTGAGAASNSSISRDRIDARRSGRTGRGNTSKTMQPATGDDASPFILRVQVTTRPGWRPLSSFERDRRTPRDEFKLYVWQSTTLRTLAHQIASADPSLSRALSPHAFRLVYYNSRRGQWQANELGKNVTRLSKADVLQELTYESREHLGSYASHSWIKSAEERRRRRGTDGGNGKRKRDRSEKPEGDAVMSQSNPPAGGEESATRLVDVNGSDRPVECDKQGEEADDDGACSDDGLKTLGEFNIVDGDVLECLIGLPGSRQQRIAQVKEALLSQRDGSSQSRSEYHRSPARDVEGWGGKGTLERHRSPRRHNPREWSPPRARSRSR
ncbi:unnamed protein product [Parajaminaea phylloscopi]